jgi:hypothetical protein
MSDYVPLLTTNMDEYTIEASAIFVYAGIKISNLLCHDGLLPAIRKNPPAIAVGLEQDITHN